MQEDYQKPHSLAAGIEYALQPAAFRSDHFLPAHADCFPVFSLGLFTPNINCKGAMLTSHSIWRITIRLDLGLVFQDKGGDAVCYLVEHLGFGVRSLFFSLCHLLTMWPTLGYYSLCSF